MKRLPDHFRPALDDIQKNINFDMESSHENVHKCYRKINKTFENYNCEPYDVNNVLTKYNVDNKYNEIVDNMRNLTHKRNKNTIRTLYKTPEWTQFLKAQKKEMNVLFSDYIHLKDVEEGIINVMKKYKSDWLGFWSMIDIDDSGGIKNINLFDKDDIGLLVKYLRTKKKYNKKTKKQLKEEGNCDLSETSAS